MNMSSGMVPTKYRSEWRKARHSVRAASAADSSLRLARSEVFAWATDVSKLVCLRACLTLALLAAFSPWLHEVRAQESFGRGSRLQEDRFKSGAATLRAFIPVVEGTQDSILKIGRNGETVALGAIIDADGFAITKASEVKEGTLTCRLADGRETFAKVLGIDEVNDVALLDVCATDLKPVEWAVGKTAVGQWAITPGLEPAPEAVGIVSVPARRIRYPRAIIGVNLDFTADTAKIVQVSKDFGAEKAGLKLGDVILTLNDSTMKNSEELFEALGEFREGDEVKLRVRRDEEEFEVNIRLMPPRPQESPWRGFDRQDRMNRMGGELSQRAEGFEMAIQHDTVLQPWQCGGPLLNLDGRAIGLNIARAGRVATYALPAELVLQIAENLKSKTLAQARSGETPVAAEAPPRGRQQ